jgi:hypothetical protein
LGASYGVLGDPWSSLEPINRFFRPLVKWTYLVDYLLFGTNGAGYAATNLLIHLGNSFLLFLLIRRRVRNGLVAAAAAAGFAVSPLHSEAVLWAAGRPDTVLLGCWLAALLLLDRWCDRSGPTPAVAFFVVGLIGIGAKESWIVFPLIASGFVWLVRGESLAVSLRRTSVLWLAWLGYVLGFLVVPVLRGTAGVTHYADFGFGQAAVKTSLTLLGYLGLGWLPVAGWGAVVIAKTVFVAVVAVVWLTRNRFGWWALLWLTASLVLTAPFPLAVLRHNYLPVAGFWLVVAALVDRAFTPPPDAAVSWRRRPAVAVGAVLGAVLIVQGWALQREIADYRRYGEMHRQLVESLAAVDAEIDRQLPVVLIDRSTVRGVELMSMSVEGLPKTFFVRRDALWQLVFLPDLADFVGRPFAERLLPVEPGAAVQRDGCTVLVLDDRGFVIRADLVSRAVETLAHDRYPARWSVYHYRAVE